MSAFLALVMIVESPPMFYVCILSATAKAHVVGIAKSVSKKKETGQIISGMYRPLHPRETESFPCHCFTIFCYTLANSLLGVISRRKCREKA